MRRTYMAPNQEIWLDAQRPNDGHRFLISLRNLADVGRQASYRHAVSLISDPLPMHNHSLT